MIMAHIRLSIPYT